MRLLLPIALLLWGCPNDGTVIADGATDAPDQGSSDVEASLDGSAETSNPDLDSCAPLPPVANLHLFDQLKFDLATLSGTAARKARIDQFVADVQSSGTYPVRDASTVVFLYRGDAGGPLSLAGSFNGWTTSVDVLQAFPDSDLLYLEKNLGAGRKEYKFVSTAAGWFKDPMNPHVVWDGVDVAGLGEFNSVVPPFGGVDPDGRIEWLQVHSPQLDNTRDVFVYLPADYDQERCTRYPVLLVNDGNESLTRSHFDQVARDVFATKQARPAILVFVALASQLDRMSEYSCDPADSGPTYADFLCDTLVKQVDLRYRTLATADSRGIIGASMGGLIAYAALWWRNDCLHRAGGQSGSFWYANNMMIKRVATAAPVMLLRAYLDNGTDNKDCTHEMRDALKAAGHSVLHIENLSQDHTWDAWQDRFDKTLSHLFPPTP